MHTAIHIEPLESNRERESAHMSDRSKIERTQQKFTTNKNKTGLSAALPNTLFLHDDRHTNVFKG